MDFTNSLKQIKNGKCGEIFINEDDIFNFICTLCENPFLEIEEFCMHIKDVHKNSSEEKQINFVDINDFNLSEPEIYINYHKICNEKDLLIIAKTVDENKNDNNSNNIEILEISDDKNNDENTTECNEIMQDVLNKSNVKLIKGKKKIFCDMCDKSFTTHRSLKGHKKYVHQPLDPFMDNIEEEQEDDESIKDEKELNQTETVVSDKYKKVPIRNNLYECKYCYRKFKQKSLRLSHERIHTGERPCQCKICGKYFRCDSLLYVHGKSHENIKAYVCDKCGAAFSIKSNYRLHIIRHGEKKLPCSFCGKKFHGNYDRRRHERIHTGEKPYLCIKCGERFTTNGALNKHLKRHDIKLFKCIHCNKFFKSKDQLNDHAIGHKDAGPIKCETCMATFKVKKSLVQHEKLHSSTLSI